MRKQSVDSLDRLSSDKWIQSHASLELLWEHFWTSFDWEPESDGSNEWSEDKAKPKKKRTEGPGATQQASFGGDFSPLARVSQDLLELELVQDFIVDSDLVVYQHATTYLIPEVTFNQIFADIPQS